MQNQTNNTEDPWIFTALFMIIFYFVYLLIGYVLLVIGGLQLIVKLLSGSPQAELQKFGGQLGRYLGHITQYIAMQRTQKPYPFSDWPTDEE